jgi:hypothetical protein
MLARAQVAVQQKQAIGKGLQMRSLDSQGNAEMPGSSDRDLGLTCATKP